MWVRDLSIINNIPAIMALPCLSGPNRRFAAPYYLIHLGLVLAYAVLRFLVWRPAQLLWLRQSVAFLGWAVFARELEVLGLLALVLASRYRKAPTVDHFAASLALFSKTYIAAMLWNIDKRYLGAFTVLVVLLFLFFRAPVYAGPTKARALDGARLDQMLERGPACLVAVTAGWHTGSGLFAPMFAELSLRFGHEELAFATVDVGRFEECAEKLRVKTDFRSVQLPSFILYEKGKEVRRLPPFDEKTGEVVETRIAKEGVIQYFGLEKRLMDYRQKKYR